MEDQCGTEPPPLLAEVMLPKSLRQPYLLSQEDRRTTPQSSRIQRGKKIKVLMPHHLMPRQQPWHHPRHREQMAQPPIPWTMHW